MRRLSRPILLFRFALREGDWILAYALVRALSADERNRHDINRELANSAGAGEERSVPALRLLARLVDSLGLGGAAG